VRRIREFGLEILFAAALIAAIWFCTLGQHNAAGGVPADVQAMLESEAETSPPMERETAMSWIVSGAGSTDYNGTYVEDTVGFPDGYNGQPVYKLDAGHYLCNDPLAGNVWVLTETPGDLTYAYHNGASLPGSWSVDTGGAPAPTVAAPDWWESVGWPDPPADPFGGFAFVSPLVMGALTVESRYYSADINTTSMMVGLDHIAFPGETKRHVELYAFSEAEFEALDLDGDLTPGNLVEEWDYGSGGDAYPGETVYENVDLSSYDEDTAYLIARCYTDASAFEITQLVGVVQVNNAASVEITSPATGATVSGVFEYTVAYDNFPHDANNNFPDILIRFGNFETWLQTFMAGAGTITDIIDTRDMDDGSYQLAAECRDRYGTIWGTDLTFASDNISLTVDNAGTPGLGEPPRVEIQSPADAATVDETVAVSISASDDDALSALVLKVDGSQVASWSPTGQNGAATPSLDTTTLDDGQHVLTAIATDEDGLTDQDTIVVTVDNGVSGDDVTPPMVSITAPADGATVSGSMQVLATITDNTNLSSVEVFVNSVTQGTSVIAGASVAFDTTVDFTGWANGAYTLTVTATDAAGNSASDSISFSVNNALASTPLVLFTEQFPIDANRWRLGTDVPLLGMMVTQSDDPPSDPRETYNVFAGYHVPGDSVDFSDYTRIDLARAHTIPPTAESIRWALKAMPQFTLAHWEGTEDEYFRLLDCGGRLIIIGRLPASISELSGSTLTQLVNLNTSLAITTVNDAAYLDGKVYLATEQGLVAYDLDTGEEALILQTHGTTPTIHALAVDATNSVLYYRRTAALHRFTYPAPTLEASLMPENATPGGHMVAAGGEVLAGTCDTQAAGVKNRIFQFTENAGDAYGNDWAELYETEQAVRRMWTRTVGNQAEVWVGCDLGVHCNLPTWQQDSAFASGAVQAFAEFNGYLWCAGTIGGIWRRATAGWQQYDALTNVSSVYDLLTVGETLYIATKYTDGGDTARLYAMSFSEGGSLQCGVHPPDFLAKILGYLGSS